MPVEDPSYVRLSDRHALGMIADILGGSRWSISGYDVKEFPPDSNPRAQQFVREMVRRGVLEEASRAEYDEVQEAVDAIATEHVANVELTEKLNRGHIQEARVQGTAEEHRQRIRQARAENGGVPAEDELEPVGPSEVHHQEGSDDPIHESEAAAQVRADAPVEDEESGEPHPRAAQGARKRNRSRA